MVMSASMKATLSAGCLDKPRRVCPPVIEAEHEHLWKRNDYEASIN